MWQHISLLKERVVWIVTVLSPMCRQVDIMGAVSRSSLEEQNQKDTYILQRGFSILITQYVLASPTVFVCIPDRLRIQHPTRFLSSPKLLLKTWNIPGELLLFNPCQKIKEPEFWCHKAGSIGESNQANVPSRGEWKQAAISNLAFPQISLDLCCNGRMHRLIEYQCSEWGSKPVFCPARLPHC